MKANVTYQNIGTHWLVILNGAEEDIELAFNSFYNHGATSGGIEYNSSFNATFWTTPGKMRKYFYNRLRHISLSLEQEDAIEARAYSFVRDRMNPKTPWDVLAKVRHVADKMVRRLLSSAVREQFDNFKAGQKTDWNKKFGISDLHEYAVHSPSGNSIPGDKETMVSKVWNGS
jgi:hypothetical protein